MKPNLKSLRNLRPGKTWIVLGVALGIGLLAALAARSYLSTRVQEIEARGKGKTVSVLVAKHDVAKGATLSKENVAVRSIPVEFAHSVAMTPDDFERVAGQPLAYPVKSGEMLLWGLMETQRAPTFSARVETGRRAMTVPVDEINSISGMLEPGDIIDLMLSTDRNGRRVTYPLMQSVQVMATGRRSVDDAAGVERSYSTVTLDTTPQQAQNIIVARETGKLTALLRNPQDKGPISTGGYDMGTLVSRGGRAPRRAVPVIYGGAGISPDALRLPKYGASPAPAAEAPGGPVHTTAAAAPAQAKPVLSAVIN